jgi:DNA-binding transcriptional MerR regulator
MEKLYYSISEVADMFGINQSNLRFWEKEFKQLKPKRNKGNTRFYTNDDIQIIKTIKFLVEDRKLTLDGARMQLGQKKETIEKQQELMERLRQIRIELIGIAKEFDNE